MLAWLSTPLSLPVLVADALVADTPWFQTSVKAAAISKNQCSAFWTIELRPDTAISMPENDLRRYDSDTVMIVRQRIHCGRCGSVS